MKSLFRLPLVLGVFWFMTASVASAAVDIEFLYSPLKPMVGQATEWTLRLIDSSTMKPIQHAEVDLSIFLGGELIFGTGRTHTHSGVYSWVMALPKAGAYEVRASFLGAMRDETGRYERTTRSFSVMVEKEGKVVPTRVDIKLPEPVSLNKLANIQLSVWNSEINSLLPHVESLVSLLYEGKQIYSGVMHTHSGLLNFSYLFPEKGEYRLIAQFSPTKGAAPMEFLPATAERSFWVR